MTLAPASLNSKESTPVQQTCDQRRCSPASAQLPSQGLTLCGTGTFFGERLFINRNNKEIYFLSPFAFHLRLSPLKHCKNNKDPEDFQSYTSKNNRIQQSTKSPCFCKAREKTSVTYVHALQLTESKKHVTVDEVSLTEQKYLMLFSLEGLFVYLFKRCNIKTIPSLPLLMLDTVIQPLCMQLMIVP